MENTDGLYAGAETPSKRVLTDETHASQRTVSNRDTHLNTYVLLS